VRGYMYSNYKAWNFGGYDLTYY